MTASTPVSYTHLDVYKRQADGWAQGFGYRAALFDCQVGDAAGGIHLARTGQRLGGAGVDAARAGAAAVGRQLECVRGWNFKGSDDHSQEEPRAEVLVQDAGRCV